MPLSATLSNIAINLAIVEFSLYERYALISASSNSASTLLGMDTTASLFDLFGETHISYEQKYYLRLLLNLLGETPS